MRLRLIYVHGWGLNADLWTPLRQRLDVMDDFALDLGFVSPERSRIPYPAEPYVAVGHSLGLLWLLSQVKTPPWHALISINGFSRFTKDDEYPDGWEPRIVNRMISALETKPEAVYMDFMKRAGSKGTKPENLNNQALKTGLEALVQWDGRQALRAFSGPVLALAGGKDAIVSDAMTQSSFGDRDVRVLPDGDHMIPVSATDWCAGEIKPFLEGLKR